MHVSYLSSSSSPDQSSCLLKPRPPPRIRPAPDAELSPAHPRQQRCISRCRPPCTRLATLKHLIRLHIDVLRLIDQVCVLRLVGLPAGRSQDATLRCAVLRRHAWVCRHHLGHVGPAAGRLVFARILAAGAGAGRGGGGRGRERARARVRERLRAETDCEGEHAVARGPDRAP